MLLCVPGFAQVQEPEREPERELVQEPELEQVQKLDGSVVKRLEEVEALKRKLHHYGAGSQPELNSYSRLEYDEAYYSTALKYYNLVNDVQNIVLDNLYYAEFAAWDEIVDAQYVIMRDYTYQAAYHTAAPMEMNEELSYWTQARGGELDIERSILLDGQPFASSARSVPLDSIKAFTDYIIRDYLGARSGEEEWQRLTMQIREGTFIDLPNRNPTHKAALKWESSMKEWLKVRKRIAANIDPSQREAYRALTRKIYRRMYDQAIRLKKMRY